ncbi:MAG: NADH-ubiquinone oxidoreductase-F iron-sulfur binding region domain-containing protein [Planctomycetota bacterium]|nr:NADH-ubiquinone oxidoreductase-F iron-sulfur binding region domain-containing protein [Planctomycetota bacterium]
MSDETRILLTRPADAPRQSLAEYRAEDGYVAIEKALADGTPESLIQLLEDAGLRGRGGASFPVATKWRLAANTNADQKFVIANGGEHEPGSEKDKFLVARYPHKVLEGMLLCGFATGANFGYVYLIEDMAEQIEATESALQELREANLLGDGILGSSFGFDIKVHRAPTTYVAGEETAAIDSINGGPGKPLEKPPYPGTAGVQGKPTTVNNVETLAHAPSIVCHGADWYRAIGTGSSQGTMLFTLGDQVHSPGVFELPFGCTFRDVIYGCGGGPKSGKAIRGILPALSCAYLGGEHLDTSIDHDTLRELGSSPGCGGITFIEEGEDAVARIHEIAQFFQAEQCGQCPACRMATSQFANILAGVQAGKGPGYDAQIHKVVNFSKGKGLCSLIAMSTAAITSGLEIFAEDFARTAGTNS